VLKRNSFACKTFAFGAVQVETGIFIGIKSAYF